VTLPFVFDGFKDHRENEQTEQRGDQSRRLIEGLFLV